MAISKPKALIDEAESLLTALRGGVLVHLHDVVYPEHLKVPLDLARSLNECAAQLGDDLIAVSADALEAWLTLLTSDTDVISHRRLRSLLDQISEVEVAVISHRSNGVNQAVDIGEFVDQSFRNFSDVKAEPISNPDSVEEFEADDEMLEIFREEAASLLENIRTSLEILSDRPDDLEALWEVKRNAHTLKGAAGIVGFGKLSALAHRVEDLLNRRSESDTGADAAIFDLLLNATNCLTSLTDGEASNELDSRIAVLEREFVAALGPDTVDSIPPAHDGQEAPTFAKTSKPESLPSTSPPKGKIVRVSLDRLDDLASIVNGLESSRLAFQHNIDELEKQLEEASSHKTRLESARSRLEKLEPPRRVDGERPRAEFAELAYELAETARDASIIDTSMTSIRASFDDLYDEQLSLINKAKERLVRLRNVEFGTVVTRLQRTVRVTCEDEGKIAELEIENSGLDIDTQIIDSLIEPLMHLLKNAVVHGIEPPDTRRMLGKSEVGKISVGVKNEGPDVVLTVTDDGRGIAHRTLVEKAISSRRITQDDAERMTNSEVLDLIFLPGLTTAEKLNLNAGRGVGMSIVRESLAASGGTIAIETWPQKGTTFTIRVPNPFATLTSHNNVAESEPNESAASQLTILVVDDSPSARMKASRALEAEGWNVTLAKNGVDGLKKLTSRDALPDLILSDIEMPVMGGFEFIAALRAEAGLRDIPVIIISSRCTAEDRKRALAAGAFEYLIKPYDEHHLVGLVGQLAAVPELAA